MLWTDVVTLAPVIAAVGVAVAVILVDLAAPGRSSLALGVALAGLAVVALLVLATGTSRMEAFDGSYTVDGLTTFLHLLFVAIAALTIVFAPDYLEPRDLPLAEFAAVLVFALSGAMLIAGSTDLLVLFLALELMVLPGYLLVGFAKRDALATEGAIKYFLLGSFSSAIFLFGLAFTWGLTGTTRIAAVADALARLAAGGGIAAGLAMGLAFMTTGVAFKIAAVPFHYWTPDAYQGSPTPVTGYLSVGPKVGAFAIILRLFVEALGPLRADWVGVVAVLAVLTMTLGNLVALTQTNVKRMLAYSSIAHTGYILVGLAAYGAGRVEGLEGVLYYSAAYTFMNLGAFAVVAALQRRPGVTSALDTFAGLGRREPWLGGPGDPLPHFAHRDPADGRLLRQGIRHPRRGPGRRSHRLARGDRGPERRGGRVLLPSGRRLHVHARAGGRGDAAPAWAAPLDGLGGRRGSDDRPRPPARTDPRLGPRGGPGTPVGRRRGPASGRSHLRQSVGCPVRRRRSSSSSLARTGAWLSPRTGGP